MSLLKFELEKHVKTDYHPNSNAAVEEKPRFEVGQFSEIVYNNCGPWTLIQEQELGLLEPQNIIQNWGCQSSKNTIGISKPGLGFKSKLKLSKKKARKVLKNLDSRGSVDSKRGSHRKLGNSLNLNLFMANNLTYLSHEFAPPSDLM